MVLQINRNPSFENFKKMGEVTIEINKVIHIVPSSWLDGITGEFIKSMEEKKYVYEGSKVYYKLPDIPGNDQEWHVLEDNEKIDAYPSMRFQIIVPK